MLSCMFVPQCIVIQLVDCHKVDVFPEASKLKKKEIRIHFLKLNIYSPCKIKYLVWRKGIMPKGRNHENEFMYTSFFKSRISFLFIYFFVLSGLVFGFLQARLLVSKPFFSSALGEITELKRAMIKQRPMTKHWAEGSLHSLCHTSLNCVA